AGPRRVRVRGVEDDPGRGGAARPPLRVPRARGRAGLGVAGVQRRRARRRSRVVPGADAARLPHRRGRASRGTPDGVRLGRPRPVSDRPAGTGYLIGAGPGAADLLTVRAARLLAEADIVFHDALVPADILALAPRAEKVAVGKRCGKHATAQAFINKRLVDAARKHRVVVRLKGGDPMLFGRAQEEIHALRAAGIRHEIVPRGTAALAAAADLGGPPTPPGGSPNRRFAPPPG